MSGKIDLESAPALRQRRQAETPVASNPGELSAEEIEREMDSPVTKKDILSLLAVMIPIALLIIIQGKFFQKQGLDQEPNLFLNFLDDLRS